MTEYASGEQLIGGGDPVDISRIEQELTELWKLEESKEKTEGAPPVVRACAFNLIIITQSEDRRSAADRLLDEITLIHPARTFEINLIDSTNGSDLNAWVSARCSIPMPGEKQVCCEQINLDVAENGVEKVSSVVTSLLVSDVPVVSILIDPRHLPVPLIEDLMQVSDHVVLDSPGAGELPRPIHRLLSGKQQAGMPTLGDLGWDRSARWRSVVTSAFEGEEARKYLKTLSAVRITCRGGEGMASALLFAGWIGHSLGWSLNKPLVPDGEMRLHGAAQGTSNVVDVLVDATGDEGETSGITSVLFSSDEEIRHELVDIPGKQCTRELLTSGGETLLERTIHSQSESDVDLLVRQMNSLDTDKAYRASFRKLMNFIVESH